MEALIKLLHALQSVKKVNFLCTPYNRLYRKNQWRFLDLV